MTNENVAVILQARSGSTRLPGKAMLDIDGQTILARCLLRLRAAGVVWFEPGPTGPAGGGGDR